MGKSLRAKASKKDKKGHGKLEESTSNTSKLNRGRRKWIYCAIHCRSSLPSQCYYNDWSYGSYNAKYEAQQSRGSHLLEHYLEPAYSIYNLWLDGTFRRLQADVVVEKAILSWCLVVVFQGIINLEILIFSEVNGACSDRSFCGADCGFPHIEVVKDISSLVNTKPCRSTSCNG